MNERYVEITYLNAEGKPVSNRFTNAGGDKVGYNIDENYIKVYSGKETLFIIPSRLLYLRTNL